MVPALTQELEMEENGRRIPWNTLWWTNIARENDGKWTLWRCISYWQWGNSNAMLVYQRIHASLFVFGENFSPKCSHQACKAQSHVAVQAEERVEREWKISGMSLYVRCVLWFLRIYSVFFVEVFMMVGWVLNICLDEFYLKHLWKEEARPQSHAAVQAEEVGEGDGQKKMPR